MGGVNQGNSRVERCVLKEEIMFKKRIICRTRLIWARKQDVGGVNQDISRVEGCVLKEEIVFVWLEVVQKASPNSKCSRKE